MRTAEIILFPNMREPFPMVAQWWWSRGWMISNRRGRGYRLTKIN